MKPNCENRRVFIGDNREVMLGLNANIADAIITDPPFNTGQMRKDDQVKVDKKKSAELGFLADLHGQAIQHYKDNWKIGDLSKPEKEFIRYRDERLLYFCKIIGDQHSDGMEAYLLMMASRLLMCHRILKETGSIFLHCDQSANGYLRMLMDAIFGKENFRNEIVWSYRRWSGTARQFQRMHDTILFYSKVPGLNKWNWPMEPKAKGTPKYKRWNEVDPETGKLVTKSDKSQIVTDTAMRDVFEISRLQSNADERCRLGEQKWTDQKPLKLYTRLVKAVTNEGDLVIDPFCGCATTLIAAENCGCRWIGIDSHKDRVKLIRPQMEKLITNTLWKEDFKIITKKKDYPKRTDNRLSPSEYAERKEALLKKQRRYESENRYCYYCKICDHPVREELLEIDHIHPQSNEGDWELENLQLLCSRCNRRKGSTKTNKQVQKELEAEGLLYHQRGAVKAEVYEGLGDYYKEDQPKNKPPRRNGKKAKKMTATRKNNQTGTLI